MWRVVVILSCLALATPRTANAQDDASDRARAEELRGLAPQAFERGPQHPTPPEGHQQGHPRRHRGEDER